MPMLPQQAIPGWSAYVSGGGFVGFNTVSLGGAVLILHDLNSPVHPAIVGNYSIWVADGLNGTTAAIGQSGIIPVDSQSLRFVATSLAPVVTFADTPIGLTIVNSTATYNVFAGDITALAGQTGELRFSQTGLFDQVTFSTLPVPEPGVIGLLLVGVTFLGIRIRRRR